MERRKGPTATKSLSFNILNKKAKGGDTTTSMPFVIFPLNYSKGRCTGSPLIQVELQAGVCTALKDHIMAEQPE